MLQLSLTCYHQPIENPKTLFQTCSLPIFSSSLRTSCHHVVHSSQLRISRGPVPSPQIRLFLDLIFCSISQISCHPKHVLSSQWMKSVCVKVTGEFARITKVSKLEPGSETARWRVGASWNWFWYLHSLTIISLLSYAQLHRSTTQRKFNVSVRFLGDMNTRPRSPRVNIRIWWYLCGICGHRCDAIDCIQS